MSPTESVTVSGDAITPISDLRHDIYRAVCVECGILRVICCAIRVVTLADGRLKYVEPKCHACCHQRRDA